MNCGESDEHRVRDTEGAILAAARGGASTRFLPFEVHVLSPGYQIPHRIFHSKGNVCLFDRFFVSAETFHKKKRPSARASKEIGDGYSQFLPRPKLRISIRGKNRTGRICTIFT